MLPLSQWRAARTGPWRRTAQLFAVTAAAGATLAGFAAPAGARTGPAGDPFGFTMNPPPGVAAPGNPPAQTLTTSQRKLYVPDLIAAVPSGITSAQLAAISKLRGVQAVLPVDGGKVKVNLAAGQSYPVSAAVLARLPFGGVTALSVTGADAIVNLTRSAQLGLARNFAVLISAPPGASLPALMTQVKSVIGKSGQVVNLVSYGLATASQRPVATNIPAGAPANYLNLFKASAAKYCPGMSWTVLAAIGQIESGDGANNGPSSAGALGPMQFMPGTWAEWGINGFGPPGPPDIMNPLDAIPSAARMLCAAGAGNPATLRGAIFAYNHATWYVDEVLALAGEYAKNPG